MEHNTDRALRLVTLFAWILAFALLLPEGVSTGSVLPVLGILPQTFSSATGLFHVCGWARSHTGNLLMDMFCALFLIGTLIPSFVILAEFNGFWGGSLAGEIMLGAYGTTPLMVSL